ncbi:Uncharacterised protein [uncultured archaeon]|nr:Uncharacterised protein [uncultured archaeon]
MKEIYSLIFRYVLIVLAGLGNLTLFYSIFTPLTVYSSYWLFSFLGETFLFGNLILFNGVAINLVAACIAGSAYYLLFILVLSTANMSFSKRLKALVLCFVSLFVLNVIRILSMGLIIHTSYFSTIHLLFWYFLSIIFVVLIWFSTVKLLKIRSIPVVSDLVFLIKLSKSKHV